MKRSNKLPFEEQEKIADRLKALRTVAGYTQEEIASKIGVSTKTYREWEIGKYAKDNKTYYYPAIECDNLLSLAMVYNVSTDYILHRSDCIGVENEYIQKKTGLSEKSINALCENPNRDIIDAFISSDEFLELGEYPLYYAEMHFNSFKHYAERYINLSEQYKKLDEKDYKNKEIICKHSDNSLLNIEVFASYIKSFCIDELFLFQKFLREYKNRLAQKYEYEKYMDMLKGKISGNADEQPYR